MSYLEETDVWSNILISDDDFEFNSDSEEEDIDIDTLTMDNDNLSTTTIIGSSVSESIGSDINISPFTMDKAAFQKAQELFLLKEKNDEIDWNDIETENFETESVATRLSLEETNYPIEGTSTSSSSLTSCVLLDMTDENIIECCNKQLPNQRPLAQLVGTWEVDEQTFLNAKKENTLHTLGVCNSHVAFDQNTLHKAHSKQHKPIEKSETSWICNRRCIFCNKHKYFYSRGGNCSEHSVCIIGRNVQAPCIGLKTCSVFENIGQDDIIDKSVDGHSDRSRYICSKCFDLHGGHIFQRQGSGNKSNSSCKDKHKGDKTKALEYFGQWILNVAESEEEDLKEKLLIKLSSVLTIFNDQSTLKVKEDSDQSATRLPLKTQSSPSLLLIKTALRLGKVNLTKIMDKSSNFKSETSAKPTGEALGLMILKSRNRIHEKKGELENPSSLENFRYGFPSFLIEFFDGLVSTLERKKNETVKQRNQEERVFDIVNMQKKSTFLMSIILSIAFPGLKVWLTNIICSLCRKPKLISSLYAILRTANVISHTYSHERRLEKSRLSQINPKNRLLKGDNIWNVSVIDNIDFKEKTFAYGNIFDSTRNSSHATLRMVFQFTLPSSLRSIIGGDSDSNNNNDDDDNILFGESKFTDNLLDKYEGIFNELSQTLENWDIADFYNHRIIKDIQLGCQNIPPPNIVILKPGDNPNCNSTVHDACDMYFDDLEISNADNLDIACDEAIFRRLISYHENNDNVRLFLGQWHTSKDMCSALITIFSGYGIFNLAANLGVQYLDKLERVVDYSATFRVLELIWLAVGIAITQYLNSKDMTMQDIRDDNYDNSDSNKFKIIKVWYCYFCWAGYLLGHKIGMRKGNFDMQFKNLAAFSPLFPVAGKSNYARSVTHFLSYIHEDSDLQKLLQIICSVNLTQPGHYLGFDEALERFGVKFVKQNISGNYMDPEELKLQISAIQAERDRLSMLLLEYVGDNTSVRGERAVKSRKESLWKLANDLINAFNLENPLEHELFINTKEMNEGGFQRLFDCYSIGIDRLNTILHQDVYKTEERDVTGRRARNINAYKFQDLITKRKEKRKARVEDNNNNNTRENLTEKRTYRKTSENDKRILERILYSKVFPEDMANEILQELQNAGSDWDLPRIKKYWSNNKKTTRQ